MWYRYSQNIQAIRNRLTNLGASQEVIDYIVNLPTEDISGHIGLVQKNPSITVDELKSQYKPKRHFEMPEEYKNILQKYNEYPAYKNWVETQIRKSLHSRTPINTEVFDFIFDWYRSMSEENKKFDITSYDLKRAIQLSEEWHKVIAGKGEGKIYTPLERDEYGNITDPRVVYKFDDGWYVVELDNKNDLMVEGNKMNHCVGSYWDEVQSGNSKIFSLRDPNGKPHVTIELDKGNKIRQISGNSNSEPSPELQQKIDEWYKNYKAKKQYYKSDKFDINSLKNPHTALEAVKFNPELIKYVDYRLPNYLQIAQLALRDDWAMLEYIDPRFANYTAIAAEAVKQNPFALKYVSSKTPNYFEIAKNAVEDYCCALKYVDPETPGYIQIALLAIRHNAHAIGYVDPETRDYPDLALEAVKTNPLALYDVKPNTRNYENIALEAVKQNGWALKYVNPTTYNYPYIALEAVKQDPLALGYVATTTPNYTDIVLEAVKRNGLALTYVNSNTPNYTDIAVEAVRQNGFALKYVDPETQNYSDIALEAVRQNGLAIKYVDTAIHNYSDIALEAVKQDGFALEYIDPKTPNYSHIIQEAVKQDPRSSKYIKQ